MINLTPIRRISVCLSALILLALLFVCLTTGSTHAFRHESDSQKVQGRALSMQLAPESLSPTSSIFVRNQKISSGVTNDGFGLSVAASGNTVVVGAPNDGNGGAVYVYYRGYGDKWELWEKISNPVGGGPGDGFGQSVDIDSDTIIVGAPSYDGSPDSSRNEGRAYVFTKDAGCTYAEENCDWNATTPKELQNTIDFSGDIRYGDLFGFSVGIDQGVAVVGSRSDKTLTFNGGEGSATLFDVVSSTSFIRKFAGPAVLSYFGSAVAISGDKIIVGAPRSDANRGRVFIYRRDGTQEANILGEQITVVPTGFPPELASVSFGQQVSIDADTAIIGTVKVVGTGGEGRVYVTRYVGSSWTSATNLNTSSTFSDNFGHSIAIDGDLIIVGTPDVSRVNMFRRVDNEWIHKKEIIDSGATFGASVAVSGRILVGGGPTTTGSVLMLANFPSQQFDFDNDTRANISVLRGTPYNTWYVRQASGGYTSHVFSEAGDIPTPADFDGDGLTDLAYFRPSNGTWSVQGSTLGVFGTSWGASGDIPLPSDFNGDGKADFVVYRPSDQTWYWKLTSDYSLNQITYGLPGDVPVVGDMDGDQKSDLVVFRASTGQWLWRTTANAIETVRNWGAAGDVPASGDYDGDLKTDTVVYRPSDYKWWVWLSSNNAQSSFTWGDSGDVPVPADYDGDGETDVAIFRPSTNVWWIVNSGYPSVTSASVSTISFGIANDFPIPSVY